MTVPLFFANESRTPDRVVNAAVLAVLFEDEDEDEAERG